MSGGKQVLQRTVTVLLLGIMLKHQGGAVMHMATSAKQAGVTAMQQVNVQYQQVLPHMQTGGKQRQPIITAMQKVQLQKQQGCAAMQQVTIHLPLVTVIQQPEDTMLNGVSCSQ